jgi:hypothetical protein
MYTKWKHRTDSVRASICYPSVRMSQVDNRWAGFDEIWYGRNAIGGHKNLVIFNFLQSVIQRGGRTEQFMEQWWNDY